VFSQTYENKIFSVEPSTNLFLSKPEPSSGRSLSHVTIFSRPFNLRGEFDRAVRAGTISFGPVPEPSGSGVLPTRRELAGQSPC